MIIVNTSRGDVINEDHLVGFLKKNKKAKINDKVKVIGQNIIGKIIEDYGNLVVIIDSDSEFIDNKLEFKKSELEEL